jgi:hypothetical protein
MDLFVFLNITLEFSNFDSITRLVRFNVAAKKSAKFGTKDDHEKRLCGSTVAKSYSNSVLIAIRNIYI